MKKVSLILAAFALVLGLSQCKKQETPAQSGENQHIVLMASNGNDGSKVSGCFNSETPAVLDLTWEKGDKISVSGGATSEQPLTLKTGENRPSATFEGDIMKNSDEDIVFTVGETPESFEGQSGTESGCAAWIKDNNHFVGESTYQPSGSYEVQMKLQYAVLKLDVSALGTTGAMTIAAGGGTIASVENVSSSAGKTVFVAVPANGSPTEYTISCGGKSATKPWKLEKNIFYTAAGEGGAPTGEAIVIEPSFDPEPLSGLFSISATERVKFSRGNLQATIDVNGKPTAWKFAENQYDVLLDGGANKTIGIAAGDIDLFGWSTDKYYNYGISTSSSAIDWHGHFVDWSTVINGENWFTLSADEWYYLTQTRASDCTISGKSNARFAQCIVNGVNGLMLFPDGFVWPGGITPPTSDQINVGYVEQKYSCTLENFLIIEKSGVVFLPRGGRREGNSVTKTAFGYWSSTADVDGGSNEAMYLTSSASTLGRDKWIAGSVRLVQKSE